MSAESWFVVGWVTGIAVMFVVNRLTYVEHIAELRGYIEDRHKTVLRLCDENERLKGTFGPARKIDKPTIN